MLEKVRRGIQQHHLVEPGDHVIVAVSGGADSLALLHLLSSFQGSLALTLHVATFDHGWRGDESAADVAFVSEQAALLDLPITTGHMRDWLSAKEHQEVQARLARYRFLSHVATQMGASQIATGHHADDQAETVFMRLLRGTGVEGLGAMRWSSPLPHGAAGQMLIRPLLGVTRGEIEAYCAQHHLQPRHDPTNADTAHFRNRVRHEILPDLEQMNSNLRVNLSNLADISAVESDYLDQQVRAVSQRIVGRRGVSREAFATLHPAIQRRLIRHQHASLNPDAQLNYEHVIAALNVCLRGEQGAICELPGSIRVRVHYDEILFERPDDQPHAHMGPLLEPGQRIEVQPEAIIPCANRYVLRLTHTPLVNPDIRLFVSPGGALVVRTREPGDRFAPPGLNGHTQKISDWMINRKLSSDVRDQIPLLLVDGEIAAILTDSEFVVGESYRRPNNSSDRPLDVSIEFEKGTNK